MHFIKYQEMAAVIMVLLIIVAPSASADSLSIEITAGVFLQNPSGNDGALLLKFDLPPNLADTQIVFAELAVPILPVMPDSSLLLISCRPMLVSWSPENIAWSQLGEIPDTNVVTIEDAPFATTSAESQNARFDITNFMRSWANSSLSNNGLLIFRDPMSPHYFGYEHEQNAPFATLRIIYII